MGRTRIRDVMARPLQWTQPRMFSRYYELRAGDDVIATLEFRNAFGSLATGDSADGCWTFKRVGFIATRVSIRTCHSEEDIAVLGNNTWSSGGTLDLPGGREYPASSNLWQTRYEIRTASHVPLLSFSRVGGILHLSSDVQVHADAAALTELPWLVMLGWYLTVMQHNDAAVVVT